MVLCPHCQLEMLKRSSLEGSQMPVTKEKTTKKDTCKRNASIALKCIVDRSALKGYTEPLSSISAGMKGGNKFHE